MTTRYHMIDKKRVAIVCTFCTIIQVLQLNSMSATLYNSDICVINEPTQIGVHSL